ncbi:MAG TPA: hypothetical protein VGD71_02325 [Kribbella sp.]
MGEAAGAYYGLRVRGSFNPGSHDAEGAAVQQSADGAVLAFRGTDEGITPRSAAAAHRLSATSSDIVECSTSTRTA